MLLLLMMLLLDAYGMTDALIDYIGIQKDINCPFLMNSTNKVIMRFIILIANLAIITYFDLWPMAFVKKRETEKPEESDNSQRGCVILLSSFAVLLINYAFLNNVLKNNNNLVSNYTNIMGFIGIVFLFMAFYIGTDKNEDSTKYHNLFIGLNMTISIILAVIFSRIIYISTDRYKTSSSVVLK
jgi:hypothetical protein